MRRTVVGASFLIGGALQACASADTTSSSATGTVSDTAVIRIDPSARFQPMRGWEATAQAGQHGAAFLQYRDSLYALAVDDLGINRLRVEVRSGSEHTRDYARDVVLDRTTPARRTAPTPRNARCARYETVNDDGDPRHINPSGFHFTELDETIEQVVLPLRKRRAVRGKSLSLTVTYVSFFRQCTRDRRYEHRSADEYAEFVLATVLHMQERYGIVPDQWEVILEPDNTDDWGGVAIGRAMVASAARLKEHGLAVRFVVPSTTSMGAASRYYDALVSVPGARGLIAELSYHRYRGVSNAALQQVADRGRRDAVPTAMLEHIGGDVDELLDDLTVAQVSAWSQYALAYDEDALDDGGLYYRLDHPSPHSTRIAEAQRTPLLRELFQAAELGDVRIGAIASGNASGSDTPARAVAFASPTGAISVAVRVRKPIVVHVTNLPSGRYLVRFATADQPRGALPDVTAESTSSGTTSIRVAMPDAGVLRLSPAPAHVNGRP